MRIYVRARRAIITVRNGRRERVRVKESEPVRSEKPPPPSPERYTSTTRRRPWTRAPAHSFPAKRSPRLPARVFSPVAQSRPFSSYPRVITVYRCSVFVGVPFVRRRFPVQKFVAVNRGHGGEDLKSYNGTFTLRQRVENAVRAKKERPV